MGGRGGGGLQGRFELAFVMPSHGYLVRGDMGWVGRGGWPGGWGWVGPLKWRTSYLVRKDMGWRGRGGGGSTHMTHEVPCDVCVCVWWRGGGGTSSASLHDAASVVSRTQPCHRERYRSTNRFQVYGGSGCRLLKVRESHGNLRKTASWGFVCIQFTHSNSRCPVSWTQLSPHRP